MSLYTNVYQRGNSLYVRGVENGQRFNQKVDFSPTLWMQGKPKGVTEEWHTLDGQIVYPIQPGGILECKTFLETYKDVSGFNVFQSPGHPYQYIAENYHGEIIANLQSVAVFTIDIETETEYGFPIPEEAREVIQLITIKDTQHKKMITWGLYKFDNDLDHVEYRCFNTEKGMLTDFIVWWQQNYPDVITGWNSRFFDLPYMYFRMIKILGEPLARKLSPWGQVRPVDVRQFGTHDQTKKKVSIAGIADLDYRIN